MALEIERKFLVKGADWQNGVARTRTIRQGYLTKNGRIAIRVRIIDNERAVLTMKTSQPSRRRREWEYPIPISEAEELLELREGAVIEKVRHDVPIGILLWEVDVFAGDNTGLVLAEVELNDEDQAIERPPWLGEEITHDQRFYNADLARRPYQSW